MKMINNFYLLVTLIIFIKTVKSVTMTKNEVLHLDLKAYSNVDVCPEFSAGKYQEATGMNTEYSCSYTFYCIDNNNCQSDKDVNSKYFEFTEKDGSIKKYIKESCREKSIDNGCTTEKCSADTDCLSNKCFNSTCVLGKSLFTECSDINDDSDYNNQFQAMKCGKLDGDECSYDKQCAGRCFSKSCRSHVNLTPTVPIHIEYVLYLIGGIALIIFICIVCCCRYSYNKNKNRK